MRRLCGTTCLLAYMAASMGILPAPVAWRALRTGEDRFPCESGHCGCMSAQACWTHCCCTTRAQRVAWAHQNGVPIPSYARDALRFAGLSQSPYQTTTSATPKTNDCCPQPKDDLPVPCPRPDEKRAVDIATDAVPTGPALTALTCQGLMSWALIAVPCCLGHFEDWRPIAPHATDTIRLPSFIAFSSRTLDVDSPPPNHA